MIIKLKQGLVYGFANVTAQELRVMSSIREENKQDWSDCEGDLLQEARWRLTEDPELMKEDPYQGWTHEQIREYVREILERRSK